MNLRTLMGLNFGPTFQGDAGGTPGGSAPGTGAAPENPGGSAPANPGAGTAPAGSWLDGLSADQRGTVVAKGWDKSGPAAVVTSYMELEKTLGRDKLSLPAADQDGKRDFSSWDGWNALGRPDDAAKYEFTAGEGAAFSDADKQFHEAMRPFLHEAGVTQGQLDKLSSAFTQVSHKMVHEHNEQVEADKREADKTIRAHAGPRYEAAMQSVAKTLAHFGGDELAKGVMERGIEPQLFFALDRIAQAMSETGPLPIGHAAPSTMTPEGAQQEIDRVMAEAKEKGDKHPYLNRLDPEHAAIQARMQQLYRVAAGGAGR